VSAVYRACIERGVLGRERVAPNIFRRLVKQHELLKPRRRIDEQAPARVRQSARQ